MNTRNLYLVSWIDLSLLISWRLSIGLVDLLNFLASLCFLLLYWLRYLHLIRLYWLNTKVVEIVNRKV